MRVYLQWILSNLGEVYAPMRKSFLFRREGVNGGEAKCRTTNTYVPFTSLGMLLRKTFRYNFCDIAIDFEVILCPSPVLG
jgi:hypothetical protein